MTRIQQTVTGRWAHGVLLSNTVPFARALV
jgi:hypothetical protein